MCNNNWITLPLNIFSGLLLSFLLGQGTIVCVGNIAERSTVHLNVDPLTCPQEQYRLACFL